jgi:hypothetical protein
MIGRYSVAAMSIVALSSLVFDLYVDVLLTHYYCRALVEHRPYKICPGVQGNTEVPKGIFDESDNKVSDIFIPYFITARAKSLHCSECLVLYTHQEGFSPGSFSLHGPLYQSHWTLSYSGKLSLTHRQIGWDRSADNLEKAILIM